MSKLDGYKKGDEVEITIRGVVCDVSRAAGMRVQGDKDFVWLGDSFNTSEDHFDITRIEPALKLGDQVLYMGGIAAGEIVAFLKDGRAVCEYDAGDTTGVSAYDPSCLTHA